MLDQIFRTYDIRGNYPDEIDEQIAFKIGYCLGKMFEGREAVIANDPRETSQKLIVPLASGLEKSGKAVLYLGEGATEVIYYAVSSMNLNLGVQITASHNPWVQTGFKIVREHALPLSLGDGLARLKKEVSDCKLNYDGQEPKGIKQIDLKNKYEDFTLGLLENSQNLEGKIQIFAFSSAGADLARAIFPKTKIKAEIITLAKDELGESGPNPMLEPNQEIVKKRLNSDCDFAIMLDGDSDRVMLINPKNKAVISNDKLAGLIASSVLENKKGSLVFDLRKKMVMQKVAKEYGVFLFQSYAGYPFVKEKMMQEQAVFGGENAGHFFYPESNYAENSMYSILLLKKFLSDKKQNLDQALAKFSDIYSIPEQNFDLSKNPSFDFTKIQEKIKQEFKDDKIEISDGIVIDGGDFYLNLRASQTEPVLRLNIESTSEDKLKQIFEKVKELIEQ